MTRYKFLTKLGLSVVILTLLSTMFIAAAQASPPAQDPRPPAPGNDGQTGGGGDGGEDGGRDGEAPEKSLTCGSVSGQVINWGYQIVPEAPVILKTGSWESSALTTEWGDYTFAGLGVGIAKLNVILAPLDPLRPFAPDAYVYLNCDYPTIANLGVYSGSEEEVPVVFEMSTSSDIVTWHDRTRLTLTLENTLPTGISNVIVTNLIPFGLEPLNVTTSVDVPAQNIKIVEGGDDGRLVVLYLDTIEAGATETITLNVTAIEDTPLGTAIKNTATLFYKESVALQASVDLTVKSNRIEAIPAAANVKTTNASTTQSVMNEDTMRVETASTSRTTKKPTTKTQEVAAVDSSAASADPVEMTSSSAAAEGESIVEESEESATNEDLLPVTGDNASLATKDASRVASSNWGGSISGISLVIVAFLAYAWRSAHRRRQEES